MQNYLQVRLHPLYVLLFFCATAFLAKTTGTGLVAYDDAYYAEKAREILHFNDWMTIHYNYKPNLDTAPLYYWLEAIIFKLFGVSEYGARLPSGLLALASIAILFTWVRKETNAHMAFMAALVFATIPHVMKYARHSMLDVTLTFFTLLSLYSFSEGLKGRRKWYLLWGLAAAGGILTKSVLGTFPLIIALVHVVVNKRWRELGSLYAWLGVALALGVGLSWYVYHYIYTHDIFVRDHLNSIIADRALNQEQTDEHGLLYRLKYMLLPLQYIPHWSLFIYSGFAMAAAKAWRGSEWHRLLVIWVLVIGGVLTMSANTKTWYFMSAFPALAIMGAISIDRLIQKYSKNSTRFYERLTYGFAIVALLFNVAVTVTPMQLSKQREVDQREFSPYVNRLGKAGFKLIAYKADHHSLNSPSLFYSDYAFVPIHRSPEDFVKDMQSSEPTAAMLKHGYLKDFESYGFKILKRGVDYTLISNRDFDFSDVRNLNSRWLK